MPDREELDDPQNPNHPMVTPERADLPVENDNSAAQARHDEEIAKMKVEAGYGDQELTTDAVNGPDDRSETASPSDGVSANEGKTVGGGAPTE